jgi:hypothetical protein
MKFTILWPTAARAIPVATQSLTVTISGGGKTLATQTVNRPTGQTQTIVTFNALSPGLITVTAIAYPQADGAGTALAAGSLAATILPGQVVQATLNLTSTISQLSITPPSLEMSVGETAALTLSAVDSSDNTVLIGAGDLLWDSTDATIAKVDSTGTVTAVAIGSTTISVSEVVSGKSITVPVVVEPPIVPATVNLTLKQQQTFTAFFLGNPPITWSVKEGAAGGTITSAGIYTAPNTAGTFHIIATNKNKPSETATATVVVQVGNGQINIQ